VRPICSSAFAGDPAGPAGYDGGVNFGETFRVENGVLKVAYDKYDTFGGALATSSTRRRSPTT